MQRATILAGLVLFIALASGPANADPPAAAPDGAPAVTPASPAPPTALSFYAAALNAMRQLPEPSYISYRLEGEGQGLQVVPFTLRSQVWLSIGPGSLPSNWILRHRTDDYKSEVIDEWGDRRYVTQRSFFDPTWYGSYRALRDGMLGYQDVEAPISSYATPAPDRPTTLKIIAMETVMGPSIYEVEDRGSATCPNGDAGHALHLTPRTSDPRRQLTDVVVDVPSMRFCTVRYSWANGGFHGVVEQHYAQIGGYWMQTDGVLDGTLREFGFSTHHGIWRYRLTDMQFPKDMPVEAFEPDPYQ